MPYPNSARYEKSSPQRLDKFIAETFKLSRAEAKKLVESNRVFLNKKKNLNAHRTLGPGDEIKIDWPTVDQKNSASYDTIKVTEIISTPDYVVVEKPAGLVVHPTAKYFARDKKIKLLYEQEPSLIEILIKRYPEIKTAGGAPYRPGLVQRLDKDASGVMVLARTPAGFNHLKKQFQERQVDKFYFILVSRLLPRE